MSKLNEIIVSQLPIQSEVKPCTAYLLDNGDGTHDRYVSDEDGNLSKLEGGIKSIQAGINITVDNTDPKNPIISSIGGGISNETDPIFSASPSATITNSDISNWNSKLSAEVDTLESVVVRGNYSPRYMTFTGTTSVPTRDGALGMNTSTYSMYFGNINPNHTGIYNLSFGYGALPLLTEGTENSVFGHYAFNKLTGLESESKWNVGIGNIVAFNLTKSTSNVFIGSLVGKNLSENVTEANLSAISPAASTHMKLLSAQSGYNATTKTFNTSLNTFVGFGINQATTTPTRAAMSTIIGASGLDYNRYRNYNNIVIGAGNYMTVANATMYNSIVIGNSVNLPNQVDVLSIGMNRNSRINSQDAIIYGLLPNTQLTFNAPITVPSTYMRNAQGDSTYTKQLVAKPNGDIGWEDKATNVNNVNNNILSASSHVIEYNKSSDYIIIAFNIITDYNPHSSTSVTVVEISPSSHTYFVSRSFGSGRQFTTYSMGYGLGQSPFGGVGKRSVTGTIKISNFSSGIPNDGDIWSTIIVSLNLTINGETNMTVLHIPFKSFT